MATLDTLTRHGLSHDQAISQIDHLVQTQAVMIATNHIFLISAGIFVVGAMVVWLTPKPQALVAPAVGAH